MIESHSQNISLEDLQKNSSESAGKRYGLKINFSTEAEKESKYHSELVVTEEKAETLPLTKDTRRLFTRNTFLLTTYKSTSWRK